MRQEDIDRINTLYHKSQLKIRQEFYFHMKQLSW